MTGLKVIGAGLGRTGTLSQKAALEILGFGPCHHMAETFRVQQDKNHLWKKIFDNEGVDEALKSIFEGYAATVDYPGCVFWEKFLEWNPEAKVILSIRDSPEAWAASARSTIFPATKGNLAIAKKWLFNTFVMPFIGSDRHMSYIHSIVTRVHGVDPQNADTNLAKMYEDWNASVIAKVPSENLLIFNVKEGWEPLCKFLGVPVPDQEFPRTNSTKQFKEREGKMWSGLKMVFKIAAVSVVVAGTGVLVASYYPQIVGLLPQAS